MPSGNRPNANLPNVNRPSLSNASRPAVANRPNAGGGINRPANLDRPNFSGLPSSPQTRPAPRPNLDRPSTGLERPTSKLPPSVGRPTTRPQPLPAGPGSGLDRPGISTRPAQRPNIDRPNLDRPNINRPNQDLPSIARPRPDRPTTRPIDRPSVGGNFERPTTLPGQLDRPTIGRPGGNQNLIVNRPNNSINNINNINNSVNWNQNNWTRPWNQDHNWSDHWYDHHIHNHYHGWYHGCWTGHWHSYWYVPAAVGVTAWGLNRVTYWNYAASYYNPYYVVPTAGVVSSPYNYSQPIVVNNYVSTSTTDASEATSTAPSPDNVTASPSAVETEANQLVDQVRDKFYGKQYATARELCDRALQKSPQDPVIHELRALCFFALGDYSQSAATLNALLASAPGMDWTTMSTLYKETSTYTLQLRKLEKHCEAKPDDAGAAFVLAYHYLVLGEQDSAVDQLRRVVQTQPRDTTAKRMLQSLAPDTPDDPPTPQSPGSENAPETQPQTDLVGSWKAVAGDATIELSVDEKSQFRWTAKGAGQPDVTLSGQLVATSNSLVLDGGSQGVLVANVTPKSESQFEFAIQGSPDADSKLVFERR